MITVPVFKEHFGVEPIPGQGILLVSETDAFLLEGRALTLVASLIDGWRSVEDIAAALRSQLPPQMVYEAVAYLAQCGHIRQSDPTMPKELATFWAEMDVDTHQLGDLLGGRSIGLVSLYDSKRNELVDMLASFGLNAGADGDFGLVTTLDYLDPKLEGINRYALQSRRPWMLVKPDGANLWVGPIFVPGRTACWRCLAPRLRYNRQAETYVQRARGSDTPLAVPRVRQPIVRNLAHSIAVLQTVRWLTSTSQQPL